MRAYKLLIKQTSEWFGWNYNNICINQEPHSDCNANHWITSMKTGHIVLVLRLWNGWLDIKFSSNGAHLLIQTMCHWHYNSIMIDFFQSFDASVCHILCVCVSERQFKVQSICSFSRNQTTNKTNAADLWKEIRTRTSIATDFY